MNDNDIIKAYKCCTLEACNCTANCPYRGTSGKFTGEECWRKAREDVLDLINRQKAEIERLQKYNTDMARKHYNDGIKEFAERLKYHAYDIVLYGEIVTVSRIERTMHEMMTEGEDGDL